MRILHVFRSPVGGLFRHVRDLARGQHEMGHEVGLFCDSGVGGDLAARMFEHVEPHCRLGIHMAAIPRQPGFGDVSGAKLVRRVAESIRPDVIHCHGAKGGLYGRHAAWKLGIPSTYTPHNGSLAYDWSSPAGVVFLSAERVLRRIGSGLSFVCKHERDLFVRKIGIAGKPHVVAYNGVWPEEFKEPTLQSDATDFMALGEIRKIKGLDILIRALARFPSATLTIVGDGSDTPALQGLARELGLARRVRFPGAMPATEALTTGRIMVLSSHKEAFPYVVIEAGAARKPLVATAVGGVPEIVPEALLCQPGSIDALYAKMKAQMESDPEVLAANALFFKKVHENCNAEKMCRDITQFYSSLSNTYSG
jgi:glycosyltransferase involved in cell wall biosynthesis